MPPSPAPRPPADKFENAKKWGATDCLNPKEFDKPIPAGLVEKSPTGYGIDYTFDCTGNVHVSGRLERSAA